MPGPTCRAESTARRAASLSELSTVVAELRQEMGGGGTRRDRFGTSNQERVVHWRPTSGGEDRRAPFQSRRTSFGPDPPDSRPPSRQRTSASLHEKNVLRT